MEQPDYFATYKDNAVAFIKGKKAPDGKPEGSYKVPEAAFWTVCTCGKELGMLGIPSGDHWPDQQ